MGQISMEIIRLPGSVLSGNQQAGPLSVVMMPILAVSAMAAPANKASPSAMAVVLKRRISEAPVGVRASPRGGRTFDFGQCCQLAGAGYSGLGRMD